MFAQQAAEPTGGEPSGPRDAGGRGGGGGNALNKHNSGVRRSRRTPSGVTPTGHLPTPPRHPQTPHFSLLSSSSPPNTTTSRSPGNSPRAAYTQILPATSSTRMLDPLELSITASYHVASSILSGLRCSASRASFLELSVMASYNVASIWRALGGGGGRRRQPQRARQARAAGRAWQTLLAGSPTRF